MRKMESYTYKKWNKMWRLWKSHKLHSPLEELVLFEIYNETNIMLIFKR